MKNPAVLETFLKYRSACGPVNCLISQDFHIPRSKTHLPSRSSAESGRKLTTSARAETEDDRLRKDR